MQNNINTLFFFFSVFSLLCCWTLNLSYFSGAHLFVNDISPVNSDSNSLSVVVTVCLKFLFLGCVCVCLRACVRMHVQLCILLFCADNATCCTNSFSCIGFFDGTHKHTLCVSFSLSLSSYAFSYSDACPCAFPRSETECASVCVPMELCASFDFSLMQSTLLEKHTTLRWTTRYS